MARYGILSLDGGGIRGVITAVLLQRLEEAVPGWLDRVDLFAGTSTGGILALGLASGMKPADLRALYTEGGSEIFRDSVLDNVLDLGRLNGAQYGTAGLRRKLREVFGARQLRRLRRRVLVSAFDLDNEATDPTRRSWAPKFFHNFPGPDSDGAEPVYKVALYTSAAPTYFPSVDGYIDGGVVANNPAMAALAQTQDRRAFRVPPALADVRLLSLGTGHSQERIRGRRLDWGLAQWAKPILKIMTDGAMGVADYQCRQILGPGYHRISPRFAPGRVYAMDDVKHIDELVALAEREDLDATIRWLQAW